MPKITIYSLPSCLISKAVKKFFQKHGLKYQEIDVSRNSNAAEALASKTGLRDTPIVVIEKDGQEYVVSC